MLRSAFPSFVLLALALPNLRCSADDPPSGPCSRCPEDVGVDAGDGTAPGLDAADVQDGSVDASSPNCRASCAIDDCPFPDGVEPDERHVLRFQNATSEVRLVREGVGQGGGFTTIYETRAMAVMRLGTLECLTEDLDYDWAHHNWFDHAFAANERGDRYELEIKFQPTDDPITSEWVWTFTLRGRNAAGAPLFADETLDLIAGTP